MFILRGNATSSAESELNFSLTSAIYFCIIGSLSLISGYCYTAGPYPLAYNGLGDIFVFIIFGLIAVPGTYYLQSNELFNFSSILVGASIGFLAVAVLCVNNIRDCLLYTSDAADE